MSVNPFLQDRRFDEEEGYLGLHSNEVFNKFNILRECKRTRKCLLVFAAIFTVGLFLFFNNVGSELPSYSSLITKGRYLADESSDWWEDEAENRSQGYQTCRIPQIDPWDDSIRKYVQRPKPYSCPTPAPLTRLVYSTPSSSISTYSSSITSTASIIKNLASPSNSSSYIPSKTISPIAHLPPSHSRSRRSDSSSHSSNSPKVTFSVPSSVYSPVYSSLNSSDNSIFNYSVSHESPVSSQSTVSQLSYNSESVHSIFFSSPSTSTQSLDSFLTHSSIMPSFSYASSSPSSSSSLSPSFSSVFSSSTTSLPSSLSITSTVHSTTIDPPYTPIIQIVSSLGSNYGNSKDGVLKCCASIVTRGKVKSKKDTQADKSYWIDKCKPFNSTFQVKSDFTLVECTRGKKTVYTDMHSFTIPKKDTLAKIAEAQYPFPPSIMLLGLDSSSRLNIHRAAPKLMKALKEVGAVEMTAYNKVGDNTLPNLLPILTGVSLPDANKKDNLTRIPNGYGCWPNNKYTFDKCPFIWRNFSQKGYVTMFGEDEPSISIFNYHKLGFREQPTDHYLRPFYIVAEKRLKKTSRASATWCYANRATLSRILEYTRSFVDTYVGRAPFFSLVFITGIGHQNAADIELGDAELAEFVKHTVQVSDGMLNRGGGGLFLSVFSDHGMRWGKMRQSPFGWMEERLPFLFIRPPLIPTNLKQSPKQVIKSLYPNLLINSKRLISPFDFHFTLYSLLNGKGTHPLDSSCEKCYDLLHDFVPQDRTCSDAAIPDNWCACEDDENDLVDDKTAEQASIAAIDHLNKILEEDPQCSHLILKSTLSAHFRMLPTVKKNKFLKFVIVTFTTDPSEAMFEATAIVKEKGFQVTSDISRLNQYGNQSWCVDDAEKKLYCYCQSV